MSEFNIIENKLREGMYEGNMHACLRDVGRLAGGYYASGTLSSSDVSTLESLAVQLSKNKELGRMKWREGISFGQKQPVTVAVQEQEYSENEIIGWNDTVTASNSAQKIVDMAWLEKDKIPLPRNNWLKQDPIDYLKALFKNNEIVAYNMKSQLVGDKYVPKGTGSNRERDLIIKPIKHDIRDSLYDYNKEAGAWIRINPFSTRTGCKDEMFHISDMLLLNAIISILIYSIL